MATHTPGPWTVTRSTSESTRFALADVSRFGDCGDKNVLRSAPAFFAIPCGAPNFESAPDARLTTRAASHSQRCS
jgi:hypothetical protein